MKYIVGVFFSMLIFGMVACGSDDGKSSVVKRKKIDYKDLELYVGSAEGALKIDMDVATIANKDSLFRRLAVFRFFTKVSNEIENDNNIAFEFLESNRLSFVDMSKGYRIISSYMYEGDSLFVMKNESEKVFVAVKESDEDVFYRTKSMKRRILEKGSVPPLDSIAITDNEGLISLDTALKFAGFDDRASMKNVDDTVVWCNVKYIYE